MAARFGKGLSMNWVDYSIIIFLSISFITGIVTGFIWQIAGLISIVVGFIAASIFSGMVSEIFQNWISSQRICGILAYMSIFFVVGLTIRIVAIFIKKTVVDQTPIKFADRILGACLSLAKAIFICSVIIIAMIYYPTVWGTNSLRESTITPYFLDVFTVCIPVMPEKIGDKITDYKDSNPMIFKMKLELLDEFDERKMDFNKMWEKCGKKWDKMSKYVESIFDKENKLEKDSSEIKTKNVENDDESTKSTDHEDKPEDDSKSKNDAGFIKGILDRFKSRK